MRDTDYKASVGMVDAVAYMCAALALAIVALTVGLAYHSHEPSYCVCMDEPLKPPVVESKKLIFPDKALSKGGLK